MHGVDFKSREGEAGEPTIPTQMITYRFFPRAYLSTGFFPWVLFFGLGWNRFFPGVLFLNSVKKTGTGFYFSDNLFEWGNCYKLPILFLRAPSVVETEGGVESDDECVEIVLRFHAELQE